MGDNRTEADALLPAEREMSAKAWGEYVGLPTALRGYCHLLMRRETEARLRERTAELEVAEWRERTARLLTRAEAAEGALAAMSLVCAHCGPESVGPAADNGRACATCYGTLILTDAAGAAELRRRYDDAVGEAAAQAEAAQALAADSHAAAFFCQSVAHLLAPPGAEDDAVRHLRAEDLPDLLAHLRERLAQARAEGEAAGAARERERVLALVRAAYDAAREVERRREVLDPSAASCALDVLEQRIEAGEHVAPAAGGAR